VNSSCFFRAAQISRSVLIAALAVVATDCAHLADATTPSKLVGTWRLVEYWNRDNESAPKTYPYGEHPLGFIVYDDAGNVVVEFSRNPPLPRLTKEERETLAPGDLRAMLEAYVAYFGTYTVDPAHGVVVHHVAADLRRDYTGLDQPRPFRLQDDQLIIGDSKTWLRRFIRVK